MMHAYRVVVEFLVSAESPTLAIELVRKNLSENNKSVADNAKFEVKELFPERKVHWEIHGDQKKSGTQHENKDG